MNQKQINRLEMFQATNAYLDSTASVWSAIPVINTYKTVLVDAIPAIQDAGQRQESSQVYISSSIRELKQQISNKMDILDNTLEAYAADSDNAELLAKASNSSSDYFRLTHEEFEIKVKNVIDLLDVHVAAMTDYGLSVAQIDDVKASFDAFQDKRGKPRSYQIQSRIATGDLVSLFEETNTILERMDNVLTSFKQSDPSFYNGYKAARMIVDN